MRRIAYWLSLGLVFAIPSENLVEVPGLGSLGRIIGLLVMLFWVFTVAATGHVRKPSVFHGVALLFVLWNTISVVWSVDVERTMEGGGLTQTYFQLFGLIYILWDLYTTPRAVIAAFQAYVLGAYVSIASVLLNYEAGILESSQRYTATGFNSNALAGILAMGMALAWHLAMSPPAQRPAARILRLVNLAYLPAALFAIVLTASRTGFFAALAVFPLMLATFTRIPLRVAALATVLTAGIAAAIFFTVPQSSVERLADTGTEVREGTLSDRTYLWREAMRIISEHPFIGVGSRAYRAAALETQSVAHNVALSLLAEVGLVGFLLFLAMLAVAAARARRLPGWSQWLWLTILAIWLLCSAFHGSGAGKTTWLFLGLVVAAGSAAGQQEDSPVMLLSRVRQNRSAGAGPPLFPQ